MPELCGVTDAAKSTWIQLKLFFQSEGENKIIYYVNKYIQRPRRDRRKH